jgi:hypothetical protein
MLTGTRIGRSSSSSLARVGLSAAAALLVALAPAFVHARRDVAIPGTACKPVKADVGKINYTATTVVNESTSQATVVCPFVYPSRPDLRPGQVFLRVIDRNNGANSDTTNIVCTVFVFTHDGPGVVFTEKAKSTGSLNPDDPSNPIVDLDGVSGGDGIHLDGSVGLVYSMTCKLPGSTSLGRSEIVDYQLAPGPV